ncbi:MAG: hypothetical protein JNL58_08185 [Planctomyces sp.]|nr:hypothetical protein [Planctomyces sp.]
MAVRCKFRCEAVEPTFFGSEPEPNGGSPTGGAVRLSAVVDGSEENRQFFKWTPGGSLTLSTMNLHAFQQFEIGQEYFIDISRCEPPAAKEETPGL